MKVKNLEKFEDGSHALNISLSQEEAEFLINYALDILVEQGLVQFNQDSPDQVTMQILESMPEEGFYQA